MLRRNYVSRLLLPQPRIIPHNLENQNGDKDTRLSLSHRLLTEAGYIHQETQGYFTLLPLGLRSLSKLENLLDQNLQSVGCQRLRMPSLTPSSYWERSHRKSEMGPELMSLKNRRGKEFVLAPTHEEALSQFFSSLRLSYKSMPLYVYQITNKYRDELNPKFGLLRANEFLMKDLYTFDVDQACAKETYKNMSVVYDRFFSQLNVPFLRAVGSGASMGSSASHEYHFLTDAVGQDKIGTCNSCEQKFNMEVVENNYSCPECLNGTIEPLSQKAIEVAHTFHLGNKYSSVFNSDFMNKNAKMEHAEMCCFGIGLSRLLSASVEILSNESFIRWPETIAPYKVYLITPKKGSKEFNDAVCKVHHLYDDVLKYMSSDVLIDDTENKTIGAKLRYAKKIGIPLIIVFGKDSIKSVDPLVEIHTYKDQVLKLHPSSIKDFVLQMYDKV
ncbi:probable proline--tRNA ligase, mitochondrial [Lepeophtheirus salmonis]|uniref:probable proline--tRNA ligase, mitochondrial n=1 Tax=Lepeophtheirus salmonis TaxID=72036 RepID=UPI001AE553B4|nr:probable proline--tRNA ligase, mitochondrial [Lepeophtheirus salmonis]